MFGLEALFQNAHVVSHLKLATLKWLQTPGNVLMGQVPVIWQPIVLAEVAKLEAQAQVAVNAIPAPPVAKS